MRPVALIRAPSNLGLRPLRPGHEPGTWRAPEALTAAGLVEALEPARIVDLARPVYTTRAPRGSKLLNGPAVFAFGLEVAEAVADARASQAFPIVIGGDCSILLGALAGVRRAGEVALVHIDGHSDFRHPGNDASGRSTSAVAGMDLALAIGRGEELLTRWPGVEGPLVRESDTVQIGERDGRDPSWPWADIRETEIRRLDVFEVLERGWEWTLRETLAVLERRPQTPFWVHFDVDALDQTLMPAVDSPGRPGLHPDEAGPLLGALVRQPACCGLTLTVYDPDLDPDRRCAALIVHLLRAAFGR